MITTHTFKTISGLQLSNSNFVTLLRSPQAPSCIMAVPHDGANKHHFSDLFAPRQHGTFVRDMHVWPLVKDIVVDASKLGHAFAATKLDLPRTYIDANRPLSMDQNVDSLNDERALENPDLAPIYQTYMNTIDEIVGSSIVAHGASRVVFLDMHGFKYQPPYAPSGGFDLILGTANRRTIHYGDVDQELARTMEDLGYRVFLPKTEPVRQHRADGYNAGHTTRYISTKFGVNAIQIEIALPFRQDGDKGKALAAALSHTLAKLLPD